MRSIRRINRLNVSPVAKAAFTDYDQYNEDFTLALFKHTLAGVGTQSRMDIVTLLEINEIPLSVT